MSATVLYDAPGPRGRRINLALTVVAAAVLAGLTAWVLVILAGRGQLAAERWTPFLAADTWRTYLLPGLWGTLRSAFASILLALVFGTVFGLGRLSRHRWVSLPCAVVVEFFRAIPVLLLIIFCYAVFSFYRLVPADQLAFAAVVVALTLYNGSVIAEVLRSGIRSLPRGQHEAARALGLSENQATFSVLLPQAVAAMLPAIISQMVIALKDSALGYQVTYIEIVRQGIQSASFNSNYFAALVVVAVVMILINWALTEVAEFVERKVRAGRRS